MHTYRFTRHCSRGFFSVLITMSILLIGTSAMAGIFSDSVRDYKFTKQTNTALLTTGLNTATVNMAAASFGKVCKTGTGAQPEACGTDRCTVDARGKNISCDTNFSSGDVFRIKLFSRIDQSDLDIASRFVKVPAMTAGVVASGLDPDATSTCPDECQAHSSCDEDLGECVCEDGYLANSDDTACVETAPAGDTSAACPIACGTNETCNATTKACDCKTGFERNNIGVCIAASTSPCDGVTCETGESCDAATGECVEEETETDPDPVISPLIDGDSSCSLVSSRPLSMWPFLMLAGIASILFVRTRRSL